MAPQSKIQMGERVMQGLSECVTQTEAAARGECVVCQCWAMQDAVRGLTWGEPKQGEWEEREEQGK